MSIQLVPGFQSHVRIEDSHKTVLYQKNCASPQEMQDFVQRYSRSKEGWGLLETLVMPLRTEPLTDLAQDLFFPTLIHFALKVENVVLRILASIVAAMVDLATLPLRLLATPIRFWYNAQYPEPLHPLIGLLRNNPAAKEAIEEGTVELICEMEKVSMEPIQQEEGHQFQEAQDARVKATSYIALKRLPGGVEKEMTVERKSASYLSMDGEWTQMGSSSGISSEKSFSF
jgi:hypothetical protein